jgi:predicted nucleotidyltransferase
MVEQDFKEFLRLLNENNVEYCIVGAYAVGLYAEPRYTKDMDILINPTLENGQKIIKALKDFGFESMGLTAEDFVEKNKFIQLGYPPVRIDIITSIKGGTFEEIWRNKKTDYYDNVRVFVIGLKDLIKAKKAANRPNDKADVAALLKFNKKRKGKK